MPVWVLGMRGVAPFDGFGREAEIDRQRFTATRGGNPVALTARELKLAEVFAAHPGQVLARDTLLDRTYRAVVHAQIGYARRQDTRIAEAKSQLAANEARLAELTHGARVETIDAAKVWSGVRN